MANANHIVEYEFRCCHCGYDLRTLSFETACPECGIEVLISACDIAERVKSGPVGREGSCQFTRLVAVAANTAYVLDAVSFLWRAHQFLDEARRDPADLNSLPGNAPVTARELCFAVRDLAIVEFGSAFRARLCDWQLPTNEDVGRCVAEMIKYGAMKVDAGDSEQDFASQHCPSPCAKDTV
jgi:uncharacterized repeat protein (TIGR04138 family)